MFRKVTERDASVLARLLNERAQISFFSVKEARLFLQRSDVLHFCVEQDGDVCGYVCMFRMSQQHALVLHVVTAKPEDISVGSSLVDGLVEWCGREGIRVCDVLPNKAYEYLFIGRGFTINPGSVSLQRTFGRPERQRNLQNIGEVEDIMKKTSESLKRLPARKTSS